MAVLPDGRVVSSSEGSTLRVWDAQAVNTFNLQSFDKGEYQKVLNWDIYQARLPFWVYVVLFLVWGVFMYWVWTRIDRRK